MNNPIFRLRARPNRLSNFKTGIQWILFTFLVFLTGRATAETYYIDFASGNNANPGTSSAQPWKHCPGDPQATGVPLAVTLLPGDRVLFRGGVAYKGVFHPRNTNGNGGTAAAPVSFIGDAWPQGVKAIIDGSQTPANWTPCSSPDDCGGNPNWRNIYTATLQSVSRAVSVNADQDGRQLFVAQTPAPAHPSEINIPTSQWFRVPLANVRQTWLIDPRLDEFGAAGLVGATLAIHYYSTNIHFTRISGYDPATHRLTYDALEREVESDPCEYSLLNSLSGKILDTPGEFVINEAAARMYLWPFDGRDPRTTEIIVSQISGGIQVGGKNHIAIEGFILRGFIDSQLTTGSYGDGLYIRRCDFGRCRSFASANMINITGRGGVVFEDNTVSETSNMRGISIGGNRSGVSVRRNQFTRVGGTVIYINGGIGGVQITDNILDNNRGSHANGITVDTAARILIANNTVTRTERPITFSVCNDLLVINNVLEGDIFEQAQWSTNWIAFLHNTITGTLCVDEPWQTGPARYIALNNTLAGGAGPTDPGDSGYNLRVGEAHIDSRKLMTGDVYGPLFKSNYTPIDMSAVFVNTPRIEATIRRFGSSTSMILQQEMHTLFAKPGDVLFVYGDQAVPLSAVSVRSQLIDSSYRTVIDYTPPHSFVSEEDGIVEIWPGGLLSHSRDYHLKANSPAINAGTPVSAILDHFSPLFPGFDLGSDKNGVSRPQGSGWDIGAYEYTAEPPISQTIPLQAGWNWISFNVLPADRSLSAVFSGILGQVEQVRTQTQSAMRLNGQWLGDLQNMDGIQTGNMYKVRVNAPCTLTVTGMADLSATPISVAGGWNWVAYFPPTTQTIGVALSSIANQVQQVRSQTQSAIRQNSQWIGDLTQMEPGKGYTILLTGPGTLTYAMTVQSESS